MGFLRNTTSVDSLTESIQQDKADWSKIMLAEAGRRLEESDLFWSRIFAPRLGGCALEC